MACFFTLSVRSTMHRVSDALDDIFDRHCQFDPAEEPGELARRLPARWAVWLMSDVAGRAVQLLCAKDLRRSVVRRLESAPPNAEPGPTRRVDLRDIVRQVHWRAVDSAFEADRVYLEAARRLFPEDYRRMIPRERAWFLHVDPEATFPRYQRTDDLSPRPGRLIGPVADKHAAGRLIELLEDSFELCRYHNLLIQTPHAKACAYKDMHRCPAPCDGTIPLEQYRRLIEWSLEVLIDPREHLRGLKERMLAAGAELRFEIAGRIKVHLDPMSRLGHGEFRYVRDLRDFRFISLQRGPAPGLVKIFRILPCEVVEAGAFIAEPGGPEDWLRLLADEPSLPAARSEADAERIGVVLRHLFNPGKSPGIFLARDEVDAPSLRKAYRQLLLPATRADEAVE